MFYQNLIKEDGDLEYSNSDYVQDGIVDYPNQNTVILENILKSCNYKSCNTFFR